MRDESESRELRKYWCVLRGNRLKEKQKRDKDQIAMAKKSQSNLGEKR